MSNRITFYSVSPVGNSTDMKVTANITISDGVATLSAAQTGNIGAGCRIEYNSTHAYIAPNRIGFDSGGTTEIKIGDKIEGGTSSATGIVRAVHIASGSWSGGDCAGHVYFEKTTGTWQDNEQINRVKPTSASNVGTTDGTLEGNIGGDNDEFVVLTATSVDAGNQSSTSVTHIYHEYSSLALWEAGFTDSNHLGTTDLTTNSDINYACCYYDHNDQTAATTAFTVDGNTTGDDAFIFIFAPAGGSESLNKQRHSGIFDSNKYYISAKESSIYDDHVRVEGIQWIALENAGYSLRVTWGSDTDAYVKVSECIFNNNGYAVDDPLYCSTSHQYVDIINCLSYHNNGVWARGFCQRAGTRCNVYNCTVYDCGLGIKYGSSSDYVKNCIAFSNANGDIDDASASVDYCATDDGDGTNAVTPSNWSTVFENYSNYDFRLKSTDTDCKDAGTDLSSEGIWRDIAGNERGSSWDIGAFEYVAAGGTIEFISSISAALSSTDSALVVSRVLISALSNVFSSSDITLSTAEIIEFISAISVALATSDTVSNIERDLSSAINNAVSSTNIDLSVVRFLSSAISNVFTSSNIDLNVSSIIEFISGISSISNSSDISINIARLLVSSIASNFNIDDNSLNIERSLQSLISAISQTSDAQLDLLKELASNISTVFSSSDIILDISGLITFITNISAQLTTSDIAETVLRPLTSGTQTTIQTSDVTLSFIKQLVSSISTIFGTSDIAIQRLITFLSSLSSNITTSDINILTGLLSSISVTTSTSNLSVSLIKELETLISVAVTTSDISLIFVTLGTIFNANLIDITDEYTLKDITDEYNLKDITGEYNVIEI